MTLDDYIAAHDASIAFGLSARRNGAVRRFVEALRQDGYRIVKLEGEQVGHGVTHDHKGKPTVLYHRSERIFHVVDELT